MNNQYNEEPLIIWQKWFDPFGEDDIDNIQQILSRENFEDEDNNDEKYLEEPDVSSNIQKPIKAIATPMGLIPFNENTASSKIFNFWIGHTNFSITKEISEILENTDGVESLDIFTRYRFRIAIGKVFDGSKVMKKINDIIYEYLQQIL